MSVIFAAHQVLNLACKKSFKDFYQYADQLEKVQRDKLKVICDDPKMEYESFAQHFPVTRYADWKQKVEASRNQGVNLLNKSKIIRFQPTSGSSEALKFIPYTQQFLGEIDQAIGLWLTSLYRRYPELKRTTHYWSVSWLPESQRQLTTTHNLNDDSALLSFSKRILTQITQAVPADIALAETAEDAMFATAVYLVRDENLGMISVWSPTFALQLIEIIQENKSEIVEVLSTGQWSRQSLDFLKIKKSVKRSQILERLDLEDPTCWKKLWPKLFLISSWDTASAQHWAQILKTKIKGVSFEGKGLWATEGVVTIPLDDHYPLMYQAHFYEFQDLDTQQIYPAWQLKPGQIVSPIITTGSGLKRYIIDDELLVDSFYQGIPCFKFLGRKMTVDLVGEKIDQSVALSVIDTFKQNGFLPISLLGIEQTESKPYYVLLSEGSVSGQPSDQQLDQLLKQNFHYELARNLGQLDGARVMHVEDAWHEYKTIAMRNGMIEGNIKPEPLKKMKFI
ncbi:GH3 auxin-responsive promoter family protein [Acinetobacter sp. YH16032]|uniref:GH3 family domain-containing protein n=1 Tax=Acinetobacter sp. YH16032 TaxID=2601181 RepID=UPI0015D35C20|nr:GH3 auxin-responsive promoter family protein [Acinetobacter sp. YH16032]